MKGKGLISKILLIVSIVAIAITAVFVYVINNNHKNNNNENNNVINNEITNVIPQDDLNANVAINANAADGGNVEGEFIVGGTASAGGHANWGGSGTNNNGYCLSKGATLFGTVVSGHRLNNSGSAYTTNNARANCAGQIRWLLDNILRLNLSSSSTHVNVVPQQEREFYRNNLKRILSKQGKSTGGLDSLTDAQIFQVQQYVFWQFTNNVYNVTPSWANNKSDGRADLYHALINEANKHSNYSGKGSDVVTVTQPNNCTMVQSGNDVLIGPIKVSNSLGKTYKLAYSNCKIGNNANVKVYQSNKTTEIKNNEYTDYNGDIYIKVIGCNMTNGTYQFTGTINALTYATSATYWYSGGLQPVVTFVREQKPNGITVKTQFESRKGEYTLQIKKTDENGKLINLNQNIFDAKLSKSNAAASSMSASVNNGVVKFANVKMEQKEIGSTDVITITETSSPDGYEKYNYKIELTISKVKDAKNSGNISANVSNVKILDGNNNVIDSEAPSKRNTYDDGMVKVDYLNNGITVTIKNKKIDLALKKNITKVTHNGETKDVSTANGFNTSRKFGESGKTATDVNGVGADTSSLSDSTNATYYMNKEPVLVRKGDTIEYSIKVFNEGAVKAKASEIKDYIPAGLKVIDVQYKEQKLSTGSQSVNSYNYDETNNVLTVRLSNSDLINAFDSANNKISNDEIIVTCKVEDSAKGILTNVAEITKYKTETGEIDKDIDSTADSWQAPNGEQKDTSKKESEQWRNYGKQDNIDSWSDKYLAQDSGLNGNKGDDDDFDKVKVIEDYNIGIQKISNEDDNQLLSGIEFYINNEQSSKADVKKFTKVTDKEGKTEDVKEEIAFRNGLNEEDVFYIKEVKVPENLGYTIINTEFELRVKKKTNNIGQDELSEYAFTTLGTRPTYKSMSQETQLVATDAAGNDVTIKVKYDSANKKFTITIPNNIISSGYQLKLIKVRNKTKNEDTESPIKDIQFTINTKQDAIATDENGTIDFGTYEINQSNYKDIDEYSIAEVEDIKSRFYQLKDPISFKVQKALNDNKTNYMVKGISFDGNSYTNKITKEVQLKNTTEKVTIEITLEGNLITIKVPNIEKDGQYSLIVRKLDANRKTLANVETGFSLNGNNQEVKTNAGYATLVDAKQITKDTLEPDTYTITETSAPSGYVKLKNPITVKISKEDDGSNYVVSKVEASTTNGNSITVSKGRFGVLKDVELEDGKKVDVTIDLQDKNQVVVEVPNDALQGYYNLEIYKYSTENDKEVPVPGIGFFVLKTGTIKASARTTDENGLAKVNKISISKPSTDEYEINEIVDKEGKYIELAEAIHIKVETGENDTKTKYVVKNATFKDGGDTCTAHLRNGKEVTVNIETTRDNDEVATVKVSVENPLVKGKYFIDLAKVIMKEVKTEGEEENEETTLQEEPASGVTFKVKKNGVSQTTDYTTNGDGKATIAEENITYENVRKEDKYEITEISFEDNNKYVRLKKPLTLHIIKGKNKTGDTNTADAAYTKFVVTNVIAVGEGASSSKSASMELIENNEEAVLEDIALEDGSLVDVKIKISTEKNGEADQSVQRITVTIPNKERSGDYSLRIKKVNSADQSPISGVSFKVTPTINGKSENEITTSDTSDTGLVSVKDAEISAEGLNQVDKFEITEEKNPAYVGLQGSIHLEVHKGIEGENFVVKKLKLYQGDNAVEGEKSVTLNNVKLQDESYVSITASVDDNGLITLTIPNKTIVGKYSIKIQKYDDDFEHIIPNAQMQYQLNDNTPYAQPMKINEETNNNGEIVVPDCTITKQNLDTTDKYTISEVKSPSNEYIKLAEPIELGVIKEQVDDTYVVKEVSLKCEKEYVVLNSNEQEETLKSIKTLNGSETAEAKVSIDRETQQITLKVENHKVKGNYKVNIKKVDSKDSTKTIEGIAFSVMKPNQIGGSYTTGTDGIAKVTENEGYAITGESSDNWIISENQQQSTNQDYDILSDFNFYLNVKTGLSSDGTTYIVKSAQTTVGQTAGVSNATRIRSMLESGMSTEISEDGTEITVIIPNEKLTDYKFKLVKKDEDGKDLPGAKFTITDPSKSKILDSQLLNTSENEVTNSNGSTFVKSYEKVKVDSTYRFLVEENEAPESYVNLLEGFKLAVDVKIDENGQVDKQNSKIEIIPNDFENYDKAKYGVLQSKIDEGKIKLDVEDDKKTIVVTIENPRITNNYSLKLLKTDGDKNRSLANAQFKVTKEGDTEDGKTFTTGASMTEIANESNVKAGTSATYEIEEIKAPENYMGEIKKAKVKVTVDNSGEVSATIEQIMLAKFTGMYYKEENGTQGTDMWIDYKESEHEKLLELTKTDGKNEYILKWVNTSKFIINLHKKGYSKDLIGQNYSSDLIKGLPYATGTKLSISENESEATPYDTYSSPLIFRDREIDANSEHIFKVSELQAAENYNNDFDGVELIVHIRTDNEANLMEINQEIKDGYSWYELNDTTSKKTPQQIVELMSKVLVTVDNKTRTVDIYMVNMKQPAEKNYRLQIYKTDKDVTKGLEGAEFEIEVCKNCNGEQQTEQLKRRNKSNETEEELKKWKTSYNGMLEIDDLTFQTGTPDQKHTITIKETKAPKHYKGLDGAEIKVTVDLSNKSSYRDIKEKDVTLEIMKDGEKIENSDITVEVDQSGIITLVIPNYSDDYIFTLRKVDEQGNLIEAKDDENGVKQGPVMDCYTYVNASKLKILDDKSIFESGEVSYRGHLDDSHMDFTKINVDEEKAMCGYTNVFMGYSIEVYINVDQETGKVKPVNQNDQTDEGDGNYTYYRLTKSNSDLSEDEVKKYIKLSVVEDEEEVPHITLELTNPREYKLRLRKTDTNDKPIDKAVITADLNTTTSGEPDVKLEKAFETDSNAVTINEGDTQEWVIKEVSVDSPFANILDDNKELHIKASMKKQELKCEYEIRDYSNGNTIIFGKENKIYELIKVSPIKENGEDIIDVQIKNPVKFDFKLEKVRLYNDNEKIDKALIKIKGVKDGEDVNEVTNEKDGKYEKNITTDEVLSIGEEKTFEISELEVKAPYVNILGKNKLYVTVRVNADNKLEIVGKGYIDEKNEKHDGFGEFEDYVDVINISMDKNKDTNKPRIYVRLKNPIKYKIKLLKVDENGNPLKNTKIQMIDQDGKVISNEDGAASIEFVRVQQPGDSSKNVYIKEIETAEGYNNNLENKLIYFRVRADASDLELGKLDVGEKFVNDTSKPLLSIQNFETIKDYFSYTVKQSEETDDGIPVIEFTMKNTTDFNMNIVKQTTNGVDYSKAKLSLYKRVTENGVEKEELIASNFEDNSVRRANITQNNINVLPNTTYTYVIKELETEKPHVNILENKEIRVNVKLEQNAETGKLSFDYNYDIYDNQGNKLDDDPAKDFISFNVTENTNGKYTLNAYIQNPIEFNFNFKKTDMSGKSIENNVVITINGEENNGSLKKTYTNMKIGDTVKFEIKETKTNAPFQNILGNDSIILEAKVMENEEIEIISAKYIDTSSETPVEKQIPETLDKYFSYYIIKENGIQSLYVRLKNPITYKIKLKKQDMDGHGLVGANIKVRVGSDEYTMPENTNELEIEMKDIDLKRLHTISISEVSSKENYRNVFEGTKVEVGLMVNPDYQLVHSYTHAGIKGFLVDKPFQKYLSIPEKTTIANDPLEIIMKNPIEYDLSIIKTDLSGNEISGDGLKLQVTKNEGEPVSNNKTAKIDFHEKDLAPNTVNTYVIEELSTIAPHINVLENKKLTVQVRVDEKGELIIQKSEVTDKETGNVVQSKYVSIDTNGVSAEGNRLIKVYIQNPIIYNVKVTKAKTKGNDEKNNGTTPPELEGASIQIGDLVNTNGSPNVNVTVEDVKIGDVKEFVISENSAAPAHNNLLKDYNIVLKTKMNSDARLQIIEEQLKNKNDSSIISITEDVKEKYRFDYSIVQDEKGFETLEVIIENPVIFKVKVVKKDATGETELSGAKLELRKDQQVVADNKETGAAVLEYTEDNANRDGEYSFYVSENSSVSPNQNILNGKDLVAVLKVDSSEKLNLVDIKEIDRDTNAESEPSEFIKKSITTDENGIQTLTLEITNPVDYDLDLVKNAAGVGFLQNTKFQVYKEGVNEPIFDSFVTDITTGTKLAEVRENNMKAGRYTYYITETKTARQRYINILDNKYIKINVEVSGTGIVKIMNDKWQEAENYYEIYEGDIANRQTTDKIVDRSDLLYENIKLNVLVNNDTRKYTVQCDVTNPIKYNVELEKVDSAGESLSGAKFELVSQIINNQNASKTDSSKNVGISSIDENGVVSGTTNEDGKMGYEETYVNAGTYEYQLKEIQTPGKQYVNPFEGYTIRFKVAVNKDGDIELQFYENGKKCYIEKDGVEASDEIYSYIYLDTKNATIIAQLQIQVENPVRYNVKVHKEIYGAENISLKNVKFKIESGLTRTGVIETSTDETGNIEFEETMVRANTYEYWISEIETGNEKVLNALKDNYIKINLKVDSNGTLHTLTNDGQIIDGKFYLYDSSKEQQLDFNETFIDDLIKVNITVENGINVLNIAVDDPQAYEIDLFKTDIDTKENMNGVTFEVKAYEEIEKGEADDGSNVETQEGELGDAEQGGTQDNQASEIKEFAGNKAKQIELKNAKDATQTINTKELVTGSIGAVNGIISIRDILIERAGTYYFEFIETTPTDPIIYKDKAENVVAKVVIGTQEEDGQEVYVIKDMQIVQGEKYTIDVNTNHTEDVVNVNITNERIKGSYNIGITKLEELLGGPVKGAKFKVVAYKDMENGIDVDSSNKEENEETTEFAENDENIESADKAEDEGLDEGQIKLYKSTDNVNSKDILIPTEFPIDTEDGKYYINDIRIERPETYILAITEISAPDTYTVLKDPIMLRVTTKIEGENDQAKYVLDTVELIDGDNDGLVTLSNTKEEISLEITNNQFDLALRKYIASINGKDITRWNMPTVDTSKLATGEETTAEYYNNKQPLRIYAGQEIIYALRVYNEGQIAGYVNKIVDHLPEQLEFLPNDEFNTSRRWKYVEGDETLRTIETDYLSKAVDENNVIKAFNPETGELDYLEVQVKCRVKENVKSKTYITNIAEITEYEGKDRPDVVDRDNSEFAKIPSDEDLPDYKQGEVDNKYVPGQEDDDDFEKVIVEEFDLALRKFITHINDKEVTSRIPVFKVDEDGNYIYEHDKTPLLVAHQNLVEYTLRIFNEGTVAGYANLVKDDIPEGLVFVPEDETNIEYRWKMLDENGNETTDVSKAKFVVTDYLSAENGEALRDEKAMENPNLIQPFDSSTMKEPDSRDLKVVFKVNVPVRRDDVIINEAQISDDSDENGDEVEDKDSTPDEWNEGEDDQDREYIKVKYFDLALYKWVTDAMVTENGKTTQYPSNHTEYDKSNMVNVSIAKDKLNKVTVKFRYLIKVENQGNLEGYAKEIKDHIPAGLKFLAEDNTEYGWVEQPDGTITTDYLKDTLLKEGETAEVPVVLTWINGSNNLGQKVNYAEISEDYNDYGSPDVDSTPDNFTDVPKEDDEDGDIVMLQVRTGMPGVGYVLVIVAVMAIVTGGVIGIKKFVKVD